MDSGFVYGIDNVHELTFKATKNIKKNNPHLIDDGRVIFKSQDGKKGLREYAPYDCIHVGVTVQKIPRELMK